ncbi:MAG TPA: hypothetical protein DEF47_16405 [Herpetosiphon sp.]|uniref:Uncharacterized protein n=1 Tax=Herpetosiphon aurantiacus (strain ATCC 23779 / DSM 785 / 114-95) TaxID=316274 RepID=A9AZC1_HERA2|nr:hypothetical protein [Herpetosiphon sp.]ABX03667.1 hypothetical protein Haur_1019 [Herpetosiphon aurantiacus DSM 785]HBW51477.1 hypothetical protein [Herpetosiphon sp.]
MSNELFLRRKWTFKAHGSQVVMIKRPVESSEHVMMKALIWALYLPNYPEARVETPIGLRYKPDVIALDCQGLPSFWGEAGHVGMDKLETLLKRYRHTHFVFAKWDSNLEALAQVVSELTSSIKRSAPIDLLSIPADSGERFFGADGTITVEHSQINYRRLMQP